MKMKSLFHHDETSNAIQEKITDDEKNILMYAGGYIPVVLIHKYEKRNDEKYGSFVQCLMHMAVGSFTDTFYDYARVWLEKVNRGGFSS